MCGEDVKGLQYFDGRGRVCSVYSGPYSARKMSGKEENGRISSAIKDVLPCVLRVRAVSKGSDTFCLVE